MVLSEEDRGPWWTCALLTPQVVAPPGLAACVPQAPDGAPPGAPAPSWDLIRSRRAARPRTEHPPGAPAPCGTLWGAGKLPGPEQSTPRGTCTLLGPCGEWKSCQAPDSSGSHPLWAGIRRIHYVHDERRLIFPQLPEMLIIEFAGPVLPTDARLENFPGFYLCFFLFLVGGGGGLFEPNVAEEWPGPSPEGGVWGEGGPALPFPAAACVPTPPESFPSAARATCPAIEAGDPASPTPKAC